MSATRAGFGDNVRIRSVPASEAAGLAGLSGVVYGETVPSASGVTDVIGGGSDDLALNVHFEERGEAYWFAADLVELVDHAPGSEIRLGGVPKRWVREASGAWREEFDAPTTAGWWQRLRNFLR